MTKGERREDGGGRYPLLYGPLTRGCSGEVSSLSEPLVDAESRTAFARLTMIKASVRVLVCNIHNCVPAGAVSHGHADVERGRSGRLLPYRWFG